MVFLPKNVIIVSLMATVKKGQQSTFVKFSFKRLDARTTKFPYFEKTDKANVDKLTQMTFFKTSEPHVQNNECTLCTLHNSSLDHSAIQCLGKRKNHMRLERRKV